jgi:hypothetical protein
MGVYAARLRPGIICGSLRSASHFGCCPPASLREALRAGTFYVYSCSVSDFLEIVGELFWALVKGVVGLLGLLCRACDAFFPWLYARLEENRNERKAARTRISSADCSDQEERRRRTEC